MEARSGAVQERLPLRTVPGWPDGQAEVKPFYSSPRRWLATVALIAILALLALTIGLP
jgi:hypothetical protein